MRSRWVTVTASCSVQCGIFKLFHHFHSICVLLMRECMCVSELARVKGSADSVPPSWPVDRGTTLYKELWGNQTCNGYYSPSKISLQMTRLHAGGHIVYAMSTQVHNHSADMLLWRVGGHGGIDGDQGTFRIHHHDGSVPVVRGKVRKVESRNLCPQLT